ncbi:MAG: xanthine dehydrogenase family protein molybdopterin-binding subunit, partial [Acidimicrobiales bacterium]
MVVPEVGGAFGSKGALAPEHAAAAAASLLLGRPVKWIEARWENFQAAYQGRGMEAELELALDRSGRFLGLRARLTADLGAYLYPNSPVVPVTAGMLVTGAYDIPAASVEVVGVATNKVPTGPYRGAGRPEAAYFAERMADLAAARLGTDPVEVRLRNLIPRHRFPYRTPLGFTYDSGDYEGALAAAAEALPYQSWRARQEAARDGGEDHLLGIGFALFVERAGAGSWESASLVVEPGGRVVARTGSSPHGQGHETTFAQVVADQLGVRPSEVEVRHGDSSEVPAGVGTFASRSVTVGGSALVVAATEVKAKARGIMAHLFEAAEEDVVWEGGSMAIAGVPDTSRSLGQLAEVAADPSRLPPGMAPGLDARTRFTLEGPVFPFGVYAAVVEIDTGTGRVGIRRLVAVDDAGVVVNPLLAEGQVLGSMAQG